jgi:hypothetical protein
VLFCLPLCYFEIRGEHSDLHVCTPIELLPLIMHTTTHILAWLPSEYMGLGDSTPALHLFYPNLIYLHVGWATTAAFRSLHYILITHHSSSVLPTLCIFLCRCQFIFRVETVTDGRNTSNIYKNTVSRP